MHLYGLIIGISIVIGLTYFEKHQKLISKNKLLPFEIGLLIFSIIGARLYHVLDNWSFYSQNISLIPQTWNGGLGIFGALIGGSVFILFFIKNYKLKIKNLFDSITPILPLCQAIGRFGNYVNGENPIWWLEAIFNLILFFITTKAPKRYSPTALYLIGYGLIRFFTEVYRPETWIVYNFKIGQIIGLIFCLLGALLYLFQTSRSAHTS